MAVSIEGLIAENQTLKEENGVMGSDWRSGPGYRTAYLYPPQSQQNSPGPGGATGAPAGGSDRPETDGFTTVIVADLSRRPVDKGIPEAGLLAELCVAKYVDHLPFYRQIKRFERDHGKATVGDWFAATCSLLEPLYQKLLATVVGADYLQVDESTIRVPASEKKGKAHLGYQWVYRDPGCGLVLFDYRKGRGVHGVMERLAELALAAIFASCKRLGVNPREWLGDVLNRIADHPVNRLEELLPHRWTIKNEQASTEEE